MPKRTRAQRKGSSKNIRTPSHRYDKEADFDDVKGEVVDIVHDPARSAPLAKIELDNGEERYIIAPEGLKTGKTIRCGISAPIEPGNRLKLAEIPEGVPIHSLETNPGEGGKLVRASGAYATVSMHDAKRTVVKLPSNKIKELNPDCKATVGIVAGSGRKEKPFVKAGNKYKAMKARGKQYPTVSAVSMNAVDHPFGGSTKPGKPKNTKSTAPPGQKTGSFGASSSGKRKR